MNKKISRRSFLKTSALALGAQSLSGVEGFGNEFTNPQNKEKVFFTEEISVEGLNKITRRSIRA